MKPWLLIQKVNVKWILILTFISVTWVNLNHERGKSKNVISSDVAKYYSYLPALFYENDLSLSFLKDSVNTGIQAKLYAPNKTPDGRFVIKMSMGMAITYLPFFGLAHVFANLFDYPVDGFSEPYHFAIVFSSLFYYLLGLIFLGRILQRYFSSSVSTLVLFCLSFGTNLFYYLTMGGAMSHAVGFALISVFMYYSILWHDHQQLKTAILIGCVGGFLILVRPINVLVFIFFFLYNVKSVHEMGDRIKLLITNKWHVIVIIVFGFLIFLPQMLYWQYTTGSFLFNSYVGEHFYFGNPHVLKAMFGFRKGWLIYTPIMLFSLSGFLLLRDDLRRFLAPLIVFFLVYLYVAFSWWCWWYGGSFGQRTMIDIYPFLAIPFAAFLRWVANGKQWLQRFFYSLIALFTALNLFQSMQAKYNISHYDSMTRESYVRYFFTGTKQPERENYLQHPDYGKALRGEDE